MDDDEVLDAVGSRLRGFRQALGLNLAELANRSGISISTISRLERGLVRPGLEQLLPLARVYGLPLDELVAAPRVGDPRVHLKAVRKHGLTFIPLGVRAGGLQAFKVIYKPISKSRPPHYNTHPGREWLYVLDGSVNLVLADQRTLLKTGEAAEFDTMTPHWIANARDDQPAEIIAIYGHQGERIHLTDL
ncbi:XRE family transcriptional regulator [Tamaricihabitans halophyticus]|uniref:XRE family transcriptional regulator n=1 Tax=Tamaricihabitans halophyticus TaxID=1262583 RepID=A0A4R2PYV2_9PSEU|nr:helix-turn-helix domain-containing protein [Tamaricihabitans halophyticus]TCP41219.1 XRE family transcriptional regulator [Tamaricihabitans halophyticus]